MLTLNRLSLLTIALATVVFVSGCADDLLVEESDAPVGSAALEQTEPAARQGKLRHPQVMDRALTSKRGDAAQKYGAQNAHLFIAFAEYEADGVTRRVLDQYGVTRRILEEYGVTRRVLEEYGVTRRVLEEYGISRRVMEDYGGLTWDLLEAYGITQRILDTYGVSRRVLEDYCDAYEPDIQVRVRINRARPGVTIVFVSDLLDTFLDEIADDADIELVEPDVELTGAPLYLREGFNSSDQMIPWNLDSIGGVFTDFDRDEVDLFILDSGVYDRDLNIVESKDFTMLFQNREEETWDDSQVIEMPFFDPGEMGDPVDRNGHGTHGAGTIGAKNNSEGIRGVAPDARIHSLKVLTDDGRTDITTVVSAIDYVTDFKQRNPTRPVVVNMSLGMDLESTAYNILDEAVQRAIGFGVVVVVSAGNDTADAATYSPAHVYEAITVGAYDRDEQIAYFSNYGSVVDLFAPGDAVVSLTHLETEADNDDNVLLSGTSSAAPHVAGAAALYLAQHPYASPAEVKQALINGATPTVAGVPGGTTNRALDVSFADDGQTKAFEITKAEWHVSDSGVRKLKIEGKGPRLDVVRLVNSGRGSELATLTIPVNGDWKYQVTEPANVPCFVDVTYEGGTHEASSERREVFNAPGSCDPVLTLTKAQWNDGDEALTIEGDAVEGLTVTLRDVQLGTTLAVLTADENDEFRYQTTSLQNPPCRVSATAGTELVELTVKDAHERECSGGMGMNLPVSISKAEYDPEKDKLKIEGQTNGDAEITVRSAASGNVIGTEVAAGGGSFKYEVQYPSIIPCVVQVDAPDGSSAQAQVLKKGMTSSPSDCERSLTIEEVKWDTGEEKLNLKGRGLFYNDVVFRNARTGEVFHTTTTDNRGKFEDHLTDLAAIPCSVIIESEEATFISLEMAVENAANNCDVNLVFTLARYFANANRLSAGGIATADTEVHLVNADNGSPIVTVPVSDTGTWRADLTLNASGSVPPCNIRATADNGDVLTATVSTGQCDPAFVYVADEIPWEQNPYSFITLSRADWRSSTRDLLVQGEGYEFMTITVRNPYNGEVLGTFENDDTPAFQFVTSTTDVPPCALVAELDKRETSRAVSNTPDNCDDKPFMSEAEWSDGALTIAGIGGKNFDLTLSSVGRGITFAEGSFGGNSSFSASYQPNVLEWIPCEVEMTSNDQSMTLPVNGAPDHCDGTPDILLSKWANGQLMLTAQGGFREPVTVTAPGTGETVATGAFDDNGMFSVALPASQLDYVPCSTDFTTDGRTANLPVTTAPDHCEGQLQVDQAKWTNDALNLRLYGSFNSRIRVWAADGERLNGGATAHDFQLGADGYADVFLSGDEMDFIPGSIEIEYERNAGQGYHGRIPANVQETPDHVNGVPHISQARWNAGFFLFEAEGAFNTDFVLKSTQRDDVVYEGNFGSDGIVDLMLSGADGLPFVPSELTLEYRRRPNAGPEYLVVPVANAPAHADGDITVETAKWNNGAFLFEAWSSYNETLILSNGPDGRILGTVETDALGYVDVELSNMPFVPCTLVLTSQDGRTSEVAVENAPVFCGDQAWLDFTKAEYKASDRRLLLEGKGFGRDGSEDAEVSFFFASDGEAFHTAALDGGEFQIQLEDILTTEVGCFVTLKLQNADEITLPVTGAPGSCQ